VPLVGVPATVSVGLFLRSPAAPSAVVETAVSAGGETAERATMGPVPPGMRVGYDPAPAPAPSSASRISEASLVGR